MRDFFRTAFYFKNVPLFERVLRVGLAIALGAVPLFMPLLAWVSGLIWVSAAFVASTGFVGFCPACYLVGRRLVARRPEA
jgi:hypothetical protein